MMKKGCQLSRLKYKGVIIGAGKIGSTFDSPKDSNILTHAHALRLHSRTDLAGFFDINYEFSKQAATTWHSRVYKDLDEMFIKVMPDIVSICVPDKYHFTVLEAVAKYKPKIVICEKPITANINDTQAVIKLYKQKDIPVLVNYSRRFDSTVQRMKAELVAQKYGKVLSSSIIYNKGVIHNGSHAIDLARYLFGEVEDTNSLSFFNDFFSADATVAAFVKLERCPQFYLMAADSRCYSIFEMEIFCEKAKFRFTDFGFFISKQTVKNSNLYKGYKVLSKPIIKKTDLHNSMMEMIDNAVGYLESGRPLLCDIEDALKTQIVCTSLLNKLSQK